MRRDGAREVDVGQVTDTLPVRGITYLVLALCFGAMLSEGYNLGVPALASPGVIKSFGVTRAELAPVFSVAIFGMLIGALVSGYLGDRFGRKPGILVNTAIICAASFGCAAAENLDQLFWLRLAVGVGLGGLLPNVAALMSELVCRKVRAAFITYAFIGIIAGGTIPGFVGAWLAASQWRLLFGIGGFVSLGVLLPIFFFTPESPKFLALDPARGKRLRAVLKILAPNLAIPDGARFVLKEGEVRFTAGSLFAGALRWITPAVWLAYVMILLVNFFITSWLTLMLADMGFSPGAAATMTSFYYVGGIAGGLVMGGGLDRIGPAVLGFYAILACVATFLVGIPSGSPVITSVLVGLIGFGVLGALAGTAGVVGLIYPTPIRAKGAGIAHSIGRLGGISGPLVAGVMMAQHAGIFTLFLVPVAAMAIAAPCYFIITGAWTGRLFGRGLAAMDAATP